MTDPLLDPPQSPIAPAEELLSWCVFEPETGLILRTGKSANAERALAQGPEGCVLVGVTAHDVTDYVVDGQVVPRPTLSGFDKMVILADGEDCASIALPPGAQVHYDGQVYEIEDGTFEFAADMPARYALRVTNVWPFYDAAYEIEAVESLPEPDPEP